MQEFRKYARVSDVSIRLARGNGLIPAAGDVVYASVRFHDPLGVPEALRVDGKMLLGREIEVRILRGLPVHHLILLRFAHRPTFCQSLTRTNLGPYNSKHHYRRSTPQSSEPVVGPAGFAYSRTCLESAQSTVPSPT